MKQIERTRRSEVSSRYRCRRWHAALLLAVVAAVLGGGVAWAPSAAAHAELIGATPVDGQWLDDPPLEVVLQFSERVQPVREGIRLLDRDGTVVAALEPRTEGSRISAQLPVLQPGGYVVSWRVVSADTHPVSGALRFGFRADPPGSLHGTPAPTTSADGPELPVLRWIGFAGLALMAGGTAFLLLCWPAGCSSAPVRRLVWAGWLMLVLATIAEVPAYGAQVNATGSVDALSTAAVGNVLSGQFGVLHLVRSGLLVLAVPLLRGLLRPDWTRPALMAEGGILAMGVAATFAGTGHSASGEWPAVAVLSDTIHLTAMSTWVGGLVFLAAYALRPRHVEGVSLGLRRFSALATANVLVLVVTGTYQAWRAVPALETLTASPYGRLLLTKVALAGLIFAIGGLSMLAVRASRPKSLRRTVAMEAGLAAIVLCVTAILVVTPPPGKSATASAMGPQSAQLVLHGGDRLRVDLSPGAVGLNTLRLTVTRPSGERRSVPGITARATLPEADVGPFEVGVRADGADFLGKVSLPFPGDWRFDVTVQVSQVDAYAVSTTLPIGEYVVGRNQPK